MSKQAFLIWYEGDDSNRINIEAEDPSEAALGFYINNPRDVLILVEAVEHGEIYEFDIDDLEGHFPELKDSLRPRKKSYVFQGSLEETEFSPEAQKQLRDWSVLQWALMKIGAVVLVAVLGYLGIYYHTDQDNGEMVRRQFNDFAINIPEAWTLKTKTFFPDGTNRVWFETIHTNQIIIYAPSEKANYQNYKLIEEHRSQLSAEVAQERGRKPKFGSRVHQVHFGRDFMVEPFIYKRRLGSGSGRLMVAQIAPKGKELFIVMILQDDYFDAWSDQLYQVINSISTFQ